ncbi:MAG: sensor N-terminal transmembrane domain-containing protein, partial [Pseudomonadota bacterium]
MNNASGIDVVGSKPVKQAEVVLGEDWVGPDAKVESELRAKREKRGLISINRSPLARKIITFNLLAILILVAGVLFLNPFRDSLVIQRERGLVIEAELISEVFEANLRLTTAQAGAAAFDAEDTLAALDLTSPADVFVFATDGAVVATTVGMERSAVPPIAGLQTDDRTTLITDLLNGAWEGMSSLIAPVENATPEVSPEDQARALVEAALGGETQVRTGHDANGNTIFTVATPIIVNGQAVGAVALTSEAGEIDKLVRNEREQVLQMFVIAILVSVGLSLVLASTI